MPRGDGTGPEGKGPRTGRGLGSCNGDKVPQRGQCQNLGRGQGKGSGRGLRAGGGRGRGRAKG